MNTRTLGFGLVGIGAVIALVALRPKPNIKDSLTGELPPYQGIGDGDAGDEGPGDDWPGDDWPYFPGDGDDPGDPPPGGGGPGHDPGDGGDPFDDDGNDGFPDLL